MFLVLFLETQMEMGTMVHSFAILVVFALLRVFYIIWWRPKSLEKQLRQQGINGTRYKLLFGDTKTVKRVVLEAHSKPLPFNHSILPRVAPFFMEMAQKYGEVAVNWFFTTPRLIVMDPELMRLILTNKNGHIMRTTGNPLVALISRGLTTLDGHEWARRRKILTPAFHMEKLRGMLPAFSASGWSTIERWKSLVGPEGTFERDVMDDIQSLAADVISRTAFGSSYEEGKNVFALQTEQSKLAVEAFRIPYIPGFRFVPTKKNRRRYHINNEINSIITKIILRKKLAIENGDSGNSTDILGLLLQGQEQAKSKLTIEEVIEECKLFYFAGQETNASLLTWTMIVLSMHPSWQDKAREEVLQICGKKIPDIEAINRLKIVTMILQEVLRLYPPIIQLLRRTRQRTNLGGMCIPAGVDIVMPLIMLHHNPEYWGDDADEFKPERFSEGVSNALKGDQLALYPFGWGPTVCLGQAFALLEAKMSLARILQNFWFELLPTYIHAPHTVVTLRPQHGAPMRLHRI